VTSVGLNSTSDVITLDQNWNHLYSYSAAGQDLSNDTQIRVVELIEREICTKMLRNLREKHRSKFPSTLGYSMVKIAISIMLSEKFLNWKQA